MIQSFDKVKQEVIKDETWFLLGEVLYSQRTKNFTLREQIINVLKTDLAEFFPNPRLHHALKNLYLRITEGDWQQLVKQIINYIDKNDKDFRGNIDEPIYDWLKTSGTQIIERSTKSNDNQGLCNALGFGDISEEELENRLLLLLKQNVIESLYQDNDVKKQILSVVLQGINSKEKFEVEKADLKTMFIEIAREYSPKAIPEVKEEIERQDILTQKLNQYRRKAKKTVEKQKQILQTVVEKTKHKTIISEHVEQSYVSRLAHTNISLLVEQLAQKTGNNFLSGAQDVYNKAEKYLLKFIGQLNYDVVNGVAPYIGISQVTEEQITSFSNKIQNEGCLLITIAESSSKQELELLSLVLDQQKTINQQGLDLLGTIIDYHIALKIAEEIDNVVSKSTTSAKLSPSCALEAVKPIRSDQLQSPEIIA
ncbi:MAG: hypothetical protein HRK26_03765 [Rickettsiaceae bacterium H1]|nr:hypothetical protein [Rickettsiaceae bacterium H1]